MNGGNIGPERLSDLPSLVRPNITVKRVERSLQPHCRMERGSELQHLQGGDKGRLGAGVDGTSWFGIDSNRHSPKILKNNLLNVTIIIIVLHVRWECFL